MSIRPLVIAIDFDGTIVEHCYPRIGPPVPGAVDTIRALVQAGHSIVLWTVRDGEELWQAAEWMGQQGIPLAGCNTLSFSKSRSPKVYADVYIDDRGLGAPLEDSVASRHRRLDWTKVRSLLIERGAL